MSRDFIPLMILNVDAIDISEKYVEKSEKFRHVFSNIFILNDLLSGLEQILIVFL